MPTRCSSCHGRTVLRVLSPPLNAVERDGPKVGLGVISEPAPSARHLCLHLFGSYSEPKVHGYPESLEAQSTSLLLNCRRRTPACRAVRDLLFVRPSRARERIQRQRAIAALNQIRYAPARARAKQVLPPRGSQGLKGMFRARGFARNGEGVCLQDCPWA